MIPISELKEGDSITSMYALRTKETPKDYRNKEGKYFFFTIGDSSGEITVKYWGGKDSAKTMGVYNSIKIGDVVEISGDVEFDRFNESLSIKMSEEFHILRLCNGSEYNMSDFLPHSKKDMDDIYSKVLMRMANIEDPYLRHLVALFYNDERLAPAIRNAPASISHNHNFVGGHLEHTFNVMRICDTIADANDTLDRDLLIASSLLFDLGKIKGYKYTASVDLSDEGQFIGHVSIGYQMVKDMIGQMEGFPEEIALKILHIILTHHGDSEKYSTKRFRVPEACALHHADILDAQVNEFLNEVENNQEEGVWAFSRRLGHVIYRRD